MSNSVWPALPLTQKERTSGQFFDTTIHTSASGKELRSSWMTAPRFRVVLRIICRTAVTAPGGWSSYNEKSVVDYFHTTHRGAWDSFLYDDDGTQRRVRFADDELVWERKAPGLYETTIELVSVL